MKYLVYSFLIIMLLLGWGSAASCPYTSVDPTTSYNKCSLVRPYDTQVGDNVIVNCTKNTKVKNEWISKPVSGTRLQITGYNEDLVPLHSEAVYTKKDGTYEFTPMIAGNYLIEVNSCGYRVNFTVEESNETQVQIFAEPEANATVAEQVADESADVGPSGAAVALADDLAPANDDEKVESNEVTGGFLGVVMTGQKGETAREEASGFMAFLVTMMV